MGRSYDDLIKKGEAQAPELRWGEQEKIQHANAGTVFSVVSVEHGQDAKFGGYWDVAVQSPDGPTSFQLGYNDRRDHQLNSLMEATKAGPVEGCVLLNKGGSKASPFLVIAPASQVSQGIHDAPIPSATVTPEQTQADLDALGPADYTRPASA